MAYSAITSAEIEVGEPTKAELFTKIKDNFIDHESRISSLETGTGVFRPLEFQVLGEFFRRGAPQDLILHTRLNFDLTLTAGRLILLDVGTAGNLEIDVLFKRGVSAFASIFSVKPIIASPGTQFQVNAGTLGTTALLTGDIVALSISQAMTDCRGFIVQLDYGV